MPSPLGNVSVIRLEAGEHLKLESLLTLRASPGHDHFYDPIRGEHRDVGFGFFSYSLPLDPRSSRAWRFAWAPVLSV
ncbi:MAG: hypothetical protein ABR915_02250 [Thermoguttaceae bacterium]